MTAVIALISLFGLLFLFIAVVVKLKKEKAHINTKPPKLHKVILLDNAGHLVWFLKLTTGTKFYKTATFMQWTFALKNIIQTQKGCVTELLASNEPHEDAVLEVFISNKQWGNSNCFVMHVIELESGQHSTLPICLDGMRQFNLTNQRLYFTKRLKPISEVEKHIKNSIRLEA